MEFWHEKAKALENELRQKNSEIEAMRSKAQADDFESLKTQIWNTQLSSAKPLESESRERNLKVEAIRRKEEADKLKLQNANERECNRPRRKLSKIGLLFDIFQRMRSALQDTESRYSELVKGEENHVKFMGSVFKFIRRTFGQIESDGNQVGNKGPGRSRVDFMSFIFARIRKALRDGEIYFLQLLKGHKPHIENLMGSIFESIRMKLREIRIHYGLLYDQTSEKRSKSVEQDVRKDAPNDFAKQKRGRPDFFEDLEQYLDNKYKRCRF